MFSLDFHYEVLHLDYDVTEYYKTLIISWPYFREALLMIYSWDFFRHSSYFLLYYIILKLEIVGEDFIFASLCAREFTPKYCPHE